MIANLAAFDSNTTINCCIGSEVSPPSIDQGWVLSMRRPKDVPGTGAFSRTDPALISPRTKLPRIVAGLLQRRSGTPCGWWPDMIQSRFPEWSNVFLTKWKPCAEKRRRKNSFVLRWPSWCLPVSRRTQAIPAASTLIFFQKKSLIEPYLPIARIISTVTKSVDDDKKPSLVFIMHLGFAQVWEAGSLTQIKKHRFNILFRIVPPFNP